MTATRAWSSRYGWIATFVWGLAEATVFFIVPDVSVAFVSLLAPRESWKAALSAVAGGLVGATILYVAIRLWLGPHTGDYLLTIPAIHAATIDKASSAISQHGVSALLTAAFTGVPYKVYAAQLTTAGIDLPSLLLWTIPSRALRLFPVAAGGAILGRVLKRELERRFILWMAAYFLFWAAVYGWYWTRPASTL